MQRILHFLTLDWWRIALPASVFLLCMATGIVVRRVLIAWLRRWAATGNHPIGKVVIDALRGPVLIWTLILGADLATRSSEVPAKYAHGIDTALLALWIVSLTMIAAKVAGNVVRFYGAHVSGQARASATLSRNLAQIAVYTLGIMILLNHIGVDIRPLLTALGVGGLAVALALQDTMANLFAGFYISVAGQIRLGDYVKLNSGEEGYVVDITWRSTTLRVLANNLIFVPNSKLSQANVTNFNLPDKKLGSSLTVRVPYGSDAAHLESILLEEASAAAKETTGLLAEEPITVLWLPGFTDSALVLSVNYSVAEFINQFGVQSELRRRIYRRLQQEGISLAAPTQIIAQVTGTASGEPGSGPEHLGLVSDRSHS